MSTPTFGFIDVWLEISLHNSASGTQLVYVAVPTYWIITGHLDDGHSVSECVLLFLEAMTTQFMQMVNFNHTASKQHGFGRVNLIPFDTTIGYALPGQVLGASMPTPTGILVRRFSDVPDRAGRGWFMIPGVPADYCLLSRVQDFAIDDLNTALANFFAPYIFHGMIFGPGMFLPPLNATVPLVDWQVDNLLRYRYRRRPRRANNHSHV